MVSSVASTYGAVSTDAQDESDVEMGSSFSSLHPVAHEDEPCDENTVWHHKLFESSLPEFHGAIDASRQVGESSWYTLISKYVGPGALVAVGYMDPGNWSTDIAGGSAFGYTLLSVILLSSVIAMFLQYLSLKAGLATGRDLAQICRDSYSTPVVYLLWIIMEVAICATDIAEVIGSAVALKLMFGLPLVYGVVLTAADILVFLCLSGRHLRVIELFVAVLIAVITFCFTAQVVLSQPNLGDLIQGFVPSTELVTNRDMLFVGVGILGATVMPHNLFLHSSLVLTRRISPDSIPSTEARPEIEDGDRSMVSSNREYQSVEMKTFDDELELTLSSTKAARRQEEQHVEAIREAITFCTWDSNLSLSLAFFVNASILVVSAATFHTTGYANVATLQEAYHLLDPLLHSHMAPILFGVALLASGQNSTLTGTLTGQIVMEGFLSSKNACARWLTPARRRLFTRLLAIIPAVVATIVGGENAANTLLLWSQVVLGYTLPFAIVPLVHITGSEAYMSPAFVNRSVTNFIAIFVTLFIIALNVVLMISPSS